MHDSGLVVGSVPLRLFSSLERLRKCIGTFKQHELQGTQATHKNYENQTGEPGTGKMGHHTEELAVQA